MALKKAGFRSSKLDKQFLCVTPQCLGASSSVPFYPVRIRAARVNDRQ